MLQCGINNIGALMDFASAQGNMDPIAIGPRSQAHWSRLEFPPITCQMVIIELDRKYVQSRQAPSPRSSYEQPYSSSGSGVRITKNFLTDCLTCQSVLSPIGKCAMSPALRV